MVAGPSARTQFEYELDLSSDLRVESAGDGSLVVRDGSGLRAFTIQPPFLVDAAGTLAPHGGSLGLEERGGRTVVVLAADAKWLGEPERRFPVAIDPTVTLNPDRACRLVSGYAQNTNSCGYKVDVGSDDQPSRHVHRQLLHYNTSQSASGIPATNEVSEAAVALWFESHSGRALDIDMHSVTRAWTAGATWNRYNATTSWTAPGGDYAPEAEARASVTLDRVNSWVEFGAWRVAQGWINGSVANNGLLMKAADESIIQSTQRFSSTSDPNKPRLTVVHGPPAPPSLTLSGTLYEEREVPSTDGDLEAGYIQAAEQVDVAASDTGSGVAAVEMLVDGGRVRSDHLAVQSCSPKSCPATTNVSFSLGPADVGPGRHEVAIVVRDRQAALGGSTADAHTSVERFVVFVAPVGDVSPPEFYEDVPPPPPEGLRSASRPVESKSAKPAGTLLPAGPPAGEDAIATFAGTAGSDLANVLRGEGYDVTEVGALSVGADESGAPRVVGVHALLKLKRPRRSVSAVVGCYGPSQSESVPFARYRARLVADELRDLRVMVALSPAELLCVQPGPASSVGTFEPLPGQPPLPAPRD